MIRNLKAKLNSLPKNEVKKESAPKELECTHYVSDFYVAHDDFLQQFAHCDINQLKMACKIADDVDIKPDEIVFFDTETTGLAGGTGTVAFLVGAGRLCGDKFVVRQFLMNDYHQEPSVLNEFKQSLAGAKAVATYNGKSFDAPLIKTRSILNRININFDEFIHFDLLHACRRLYKMRLERMKLIDIEEHILGMERDDDIPGSEIPEIFFNYLKYGDSTMLQKVIEHNLNDIVSLAKISGVLSKAYKAPERADCKQDAFCAARTMLQMGDYNRARSIFEAVGDTVEEAQVELAYLLKRMGDYERAVEIFDVLAENSRFSIEYDIEVAKIYEHRMKNYELAVNYAMRAKQKQFNNRLLGRNSNIIDDVEKRILRLKHKIERER